MFAVVTGPTHAYEQTRLDGSVYLVPSFQDLLNAKIAELEDNGAVVERPIDCKPSLDCTSHAAYLSYHIPESDAVAVAAPEYLTMQEVADRLDVSRWFVSDRIRRGELEAKTFGKLKKIPVSSYNAYLAAH